MNRIEFTKNVLDFAIEAGFKLVSTKNVGDKSYEKATRMPNGDFWCNSVVKTNKEEKEYNQKSFIAILLDDENEKDNNRYTDFSLVIFPQIENDEIKKCLIGLVVGTNGFSKDSQIASLPYPKRYFMKMKKYGAKLYFKHNFENIEYTIPELLGIQSNYQQIEKYGNYIQIAEVEDNFDTSNLITIGNNDNNITLPKSIFRWILFYAGFRNWKKEKDLKNLLKKTKVSEGVNQNLFSGPDTDEIFDVLLSDKYVVLQGAPGVGKTYTTSRLSKKFKETIFEQFHAETTYSDFIYGIIPDTSNKETLVYKNNPGILYNAIGKALNLLNKDWDYLRRPLERDYAYDENTSVLLIIDEINRANLANVLGQVFYLFERSSQERENLISIGDKKICRLPENLYVIGTMNTADRSLAVVDFALRRRFTWLTLRPKDLSDESLDGQYNYFNAEEFNWFNDVFEKYASDEELNLQPGQEYFLTKKPEEGYNSEECPPEKKTMYSNMKYRLMPLIKEYLNEGFLQRAKDEFSVYFFNNWHLNLYE